MWSYMLAPPPLQAEFGVARADASLPCTFVMIGFATGGVLMGRLADHFGVAVPVAIMFPGFVIRRSTAFSADSGQDCRKCRWHERSSGSPRSARLGSLSAAILRDQRQRSAGGPGLGLIHRRQRS